MIPLSQKVAIRYLEAKGFNLDIGQPIWFGKYKNKAGIIKGFSTDKKGNPTIIVEPSPRGRKKNKTIQLFRVWKRDKNQEE